MAIVGIALMGASIYVTGSGAQASKRSIDDGSRLVGNWTGESICIGSNPNCHDEKVVYRISKSSGEPGKVTIAADKIIDGKPELMYVLDFKYDGEKGTLVGEFQNARYHGIWEYTVKGDLMEGTLSLLPDKTVVRRVKVKKDK
jgi:hypothetical protein